MRPPAVEVMAHTVDGWASVRVASEAFASARAGQFALLPLGDDAGHLLRRVFWVGTTSARGVTELIGRATADELRWLERESPLPDGPFGNGFPAAGTAPALVLSCDDGAIVAGRLMATWPEGRRLSFTRSGAPAHGALVVHALPMNAGGARQVLEAVAELEESGGPTPRILAAGPRSFARWLHGIAFEPEERAAALFAVTDIAMPCGIGACFGCPVEVRHGPPAVCCTEGPVFPLEVLDA